MTDMAFLEWAKAENNTVRFYISGASEALLSKRTVAYVITRKKDSYHIGTFSGILLPKETEGAAVDISLDKNITYIVYASIFDNTGAVIDTTSSYEIFVEGELDLFLVEQTAVGKKLIDVTWKCSQMLGSSYEIYAALGDDENADFYLKASGSFTSEPQTVTISVDSFAYYSIKLILSDSYGVMTNIRTVSVYENTDKPPTPQNVRISRKDSYGDDILIGLTWDAVSGYEYSIEAYYYDDGSRYGGSVRWNSSSDLSDYCENPFNLCNIMEFSSINHGEKCSVGISTYNPSSGKCSDTVWLKNRYTAPYKPEFSVSADENGIVSVSCKEYRYFTYINVLLSKWDSENSLYIIQESKRLYREDMNENTDSYKQQFWEGTIFLDTSEYGSGKYQISGRAYIDDALNNEYAIRSEASSKHIISVSLPKPMPFSWTYEKKKGSIFNLKAAEWNELTDRIKAVYSYSGKTAPKLAAAVIGSDFTADMYNEARKAIQAYSAGAGSYIPTVLQGGFITADTESDLPENNNINIIVSELNSIIEYL